MFYPSTNCRSPHMNIDNLRDQLFQAFIFSSVLLSSLELSDTQSL